MSWPKGMLLPCAGCGGGRGCGTALSHSGGSGTAQQGKSWPVPTPVLWEERVTWTACNSGVWSGTTFCWSFARKFGAVRHTRLDISPSLQLPLKLLCEVFPPWARALFPSLLHAQQSPSQAQPWLCPSLPALRAWVSICRNHSCCCCCAGEVQGLLRIHTAASGRRGST